MTIIERCISVISILAIVSCTPDRNVVQIVSGNVIRLASGDDVCLENVANSRNNYDFLCANLLWQDVIVVESRRETSSYGNIIYGVVYDSNSMCINDMLEKETPVSSPRPTGPRSITPEDTVVPEPKPSGFSDAYWSKPNVKSTKDVSDIYSYVLGVFTRYDVNYMPHIPVLIVAREEMLAESGNKNTVGLAYTRSFIDGEQSFEIHIIEGLNRLDFAEVLAHEIMHTWVHQNGINIIDEAEEEGLCNYASYIVLSDVGNAYAKSLINSMMNNPDPIYGKGFRYVKAEIEDIGFHQYLQGLGYRSPNKGVSNTTQPHPNAENMEIPITRDRNNSQVVAHLGYTLSYNADLRIADWVAYQLTAEEARGKVARSDSWSSDPLVKGAQGSSDDYRGSGWDRGHLAPAGDMKWSSVAMDESFYYTNICPQDGNLNSGQWRELEEECRSLAINYGYIYIVCGGVVIDNKYGKLGYNRVTIPDAFFKVLLIKQHNEYKGIGFYFENEPAQSGYMNYSTTIDQIENITDMDFFSMLPDDIENRVESEVDFPMS